MENHISTTIEQSKHLLELGLSPDSADMWWSNRFVYWLPTPMIGVATEQNQLYTFKWCEEDIPAWSLSALLEVMPSFIEHKGQKLRLTLEKAGIWNVFYLSDTRLNEIWFNGEYGDPVEPAYKMVCWLLEQKILNYDNHEKD